MIGAHMTLRAGAGKARDADGTRVARMAGSAVADCAVTIRFTYAVTLFAAARHRGSTFQLDERMRRTPSSARLIGLREIHLLGREPLFSIDGSPCRSSVAAVQELLVDRFVAAPTIAGCEFGGDHESVMIFLLLTLRGLVTLKAVNALTGMCAHLVLVNDRILCALMTLGTFAGGADEFRTGLCRFDLRAGSVQKEGGNDQRKRDYNGNEDGAEGHTASRFQKGDRRV